MFWPQPCVWFPFCATFRQKTEKGWVLSQLHIRIFCQNRACRMSFSTLGHSVRHQPLQWEFVTSHQKRQSAKYETQGVWPQKRGIILATSHWLSLAEDESWSFPAHRLSLPHSVYAMRPSTPAGRITLRLSALMSEICFGHNLTRDLSTASVSPKAEVKVRLGPLYSKMLDPSSRLMRTIWSPAEITLLSPLCKAAHLIQISVNSK